MNQNHSKTNHKFIKEMTISYTLYIQNFQKQDNLTFMTKMKQKEKLSFQLT